MLRSCLCFLLLTFSLVATEFELASPFSEQMVLQRGIPVPVWGWGPAGQTVTVTVADQKGTATIDAQGHWRLTLNALKAGGPHTFVARSGKDELKLENVLIGEVWICSGQSNMAMGYNSIPDIKKLAEESKKRPIRCLPIPTTVAFKPQERCKAKWSKGPPSSAVACAFAYDLQAAAKVPVGIILSAWGSSSIEGWMPLDLTAQLPHFKAAMEQFEQKDRKRVAELIEQAESGKRWARGDNIYLRTRPNILYNAMLHPIAPFAVRGLVWYQGEANTRNYESMMQYGESLKTWTQRLRKQWGREDFHLLAVMLPRFGRCSKGGKSQDPNHPEAHTWAWMRDSQLRLLELPCTGVANTVDLGDAKNIHPKDKRPIGKRLALLAQRDVLKQDVVAQGPQIKEIVAEGAKLRVRFTDAEGLRTTDGKTPRSFWVAGDQGEWHPAEATIDGQEILLHAAAVPQPKRACYAFAAIPDVNLVNGAGLPALPFRFPGATVGKQ